MTDDQWPSGSDGFLREPFAGRRPRASIAQTREAVLETRKWKRIAGGMAAACLMLVALIGVAFVQRAAELKVAEGT